MNSPALSDESPKAVVRSPSRRAGAEPGEPVDSVQGRGERTADTQRASLVDEIPSITLIRSQSIILITLTFCSALLPAAFCDDASSQQTYPLGSY